jgi:hypothetical protein
VSDPQLGEEIFPRLESLRSPDGGSPDAEFHIRNEGGQICLSHAGQLISSEENPNAIRAILLQEMVHCTEGGREWLGILHAGACGTDDRCVLLAGSSHSGKTTLSAALMGSGLKYYCDDSAAIGKHDYRVSPMPFRMMVREGSWEVLAPRFPDLVSSSVVNRDGHKVRFLSPPPGQIAPSPGLPTFLFLVSFSPGEKTSLRPLLPFEALVRLRESGFYVRQDRHDIGRFLSWLLSLPAFVLVYSDLNDAINKIREVSDL